MEHIKLSEISKRDNNMMLLGNDDLLDLVEMDDLIFDDFKIDEHHLILVIYEILCEISSDEDLDDFDDEIL
jgi:hypothetical protein